MGRAPCCDKANVKRGPWSPEEDTTLKNYLHKHGTGGNWISLPQRAGLKRCGKSCRLRWLNYLRPDIKHGAFTEEEDAIIISLYSKMGSRWSVIAANLPGRTDNDVKNHWNTKLKKKLFGGGGRDRVNSNNNKFNLSNPTKIKNVTFTNKKIINLPFHSQSQGQGSSYTPTPSPSPSPTYLENTHNYSANNNYDQFYVTIPSFSNLLAQCNTTNNSPLLPFPTYNNPLTNNNLGPDPNQNLYPSLYPIDHLVNSQARIMSQYNPTIYPSTQNKEALSIPISTYSGLEDDSFFNELGFGLIHEVMMNPTCSYDDHQEDIKPQGLGQGCG